MLVLLSPDHTIYIASFVTQTLAVERGFILQGEFHDDGSGHHQTVSEFGLSVKSSRFITSILCILWESSDKLLNKLYDINYKVKFGM